ncbi:MAG: nicotinate (nicotinamide) nucleotide adenylyltransferase [Acidobacteria bacterium]|nr:nicotinate (nicotinamide) nucleotide adenylyltransferase [Acidobacteriota bacterium]
MSGEGAVGILGGTFDPIHVGHLDLARAALTHLDLPRVVLIPSHVPPHRPIQPIVSPYHRFAMTVLAAAQDERLVASDMELRAPGPSYTIETLDRFLRQGYGAQEIFFITGADAFAEIATWKDYPALLGLSHFVVVSRPEHPVAQLPDALSSLSDRMRFVATPPRGTSAASRVREMRDGPTAIFLVDVATTNVSSTEVRARLATLRPIGGLVPPAVEQHIRKYHLYSPAPRAA